MNMRRNLGFLKNFSGVFKAVFLSVLLSGALCESATYGQKAALPDINAKVSGSITCKSISVKLTGSSKTPGVYYTWSGPRGYYSTAQNPVTTMPGEYTLKVTDPISGGVATSMIKVSVDTTAPAGIKADVSGVLNCKDTLVMLKGNSSTPGVTYQWKGPKNFIAAIQNQETNFPGVYSLQVTNPVNGCISKVNVVVSQKIETPLGVVATASGILNCKNPSVTLTGVSTTKNVQYHWSGPDFSSKTDKSTVTVPGTYKLEVINPLNGCSSKASVIVKQDVSISILEKIANADTLTCKTKKITLGVPSNKNLIFNWLQQNGITSTESSIETDTPGNLLLTVTNPENGCSSKKQITVAKDTVAPEGVSASVSDSLSCKNRNVKLTGISLSKKVSFSWSGPNGFNSAEKSPEAKSPGSYTLTAVNSQNGCTVKTNVIVGGKTCNEKLLK
jgi:hypothetical protein